MHIARAPIQHIPIIREDISSVTETETETDRTGTTTTTTTTSSGTIRSSSDSTPERHIVQLRDDISDDTYEESDDHVSEQEVDFYTGDDNRYNK